MMKKVLIIGTEGCGKTTMKVRLTTGDFVREHTPTEGPETFYLNRDSGEPLCEVTAIRPENLSYADLQKYDAFIWMFDATNRESMKTILDVYVCTEQPSVIVANKMDVSDENLFEELKLAAREMGHLKTFQTSYKSNYNFEKPFEACGMCF